MNRKSKERKKKKEKFVLINTPSIPKYKDKFLNIKSLPILSQVLPKLPLDSLFSLKTPSPFKVT